MIIKCVSILMNKALVSQIGLEMTVLSRLKTFTHIVEKIPNSFRFREVYI